MSETTATQPGQTAAPTGAGTDTPANGTSGQTDQSTAQTSPEAAPAQTGAQAKDILVAKVRGAEIPVDMSDKRRVQELLQKGLDYDTAKEKFEERVHARAQEILQEQAQRQAEEQRLSQMREIDPVAYELEVYKKADGEKAQAIERQVQQLQETIHSLTWTQQVAEAKRQHPDLNQRDWNRAFAEVVASKGQTQLMEAARLVKDERDAFKKEVRDALLQELKTNANSAIPAVPSGAGGTPAPQAAAQNGINFSDKESVRLAARDYIKSFQGGA